MPHVKPPAIVVAYRAGRGVDHWRQRNAQSPVPGGWPYGLDGLGAGGLSIEPREVDEPGGVRRRVAALTGLRRRHAGPADPAVAVAWDESTAVPMLSGLAAHAYWSGVIWATDAVAAGEDSTRLRLAASALRQLDGLWVLSRPQVEVVRRWLGPDCPPVHFLRFGVEPQFYDFRPYPDEPHVVSVGGDRDRDAESLFAALAIVRAQRPDVRCTVQSTSTAEPPAGVAKVAHLPHLGVADLLASATVVAIATRPNLHASGMTVGLEAMSVGRPVVVCDTPGMDDYFEDGVTSRRVPPRDPQAMAAAILSYLDNSETAAETGRRGRAAVLDRFTTTSMCADLIRLIQTGRQRT